MFVCLQKDAKQGCDATQLGHTRCASQRPTAVDQRYEYSQALSRHRLFGVFWRQTNIKISRDLDIHCSTITITIVDLFMGELKLN